MRCIYASGAGFVQFFLVVKFACCFTVSVVIVRHFVHCIVSFASCEEVEEVHAVYLMQAVQVSCNFVFLL